MVVLHLMDQAKVDLVDLVVVAQEQNRQVRVQQDKEMLVALHLHQTIKTVVAAVVPVKQVTLMASNKAVTVFKYPGFQHHMVKVDTSPVVVAAVPKLVLLVVREAVAVAAVVDLVAHLTLAAVALPKMVMLETQTLAEAVVEKDLLVPVPMVDQVSLF